MFTIVSMNYLSYAATLMQSVRAHHPDSARFIILADTPRPFPAIDLAAELIPSDALGIGLIGNMRLWYSVIELNTALKPYVFRHFLDRGHRHVCYLDPDIILHGPMTEVFTALERNSLVLTPHLLRPLNTRPLPDELEPNDHTILKAGIYNLGFVAMRRDPDAARLVEWWAARCFTQCRADVDANLFVDQRWMDMAPGFVARTAILRHPGYNVAYWNLAHRAVRHDGKDWRVDGEKLVFFHFSGLKPDDPTVFSSFQTRFSLAELGEVARLGTEFRARIMANGWRLTSQMPYGYGSFADGRPIEAPMRRWLLRAADEARLDPLAPLEIGSDHFDLPDETAAARGIAMTRMMYQTWLDRPDLRLVFDIHTADGLDAYIAWFTGPDAEIAAPSVAAARALYGLHRRGEIDPTRAAVAQANPAATPWPPVVAQSWAGAARDVAQWLRQDVRTGSWDEDPLVPLQAALAWERRPDLQAGFPVGTTGRLSEFLVWVLVQGCSEGAIDPTLFSDAFMAQQARPAPLASLGGSAADDMPVTAAMMLTRRVTERRAYLNFWELFPGDRRGRLAHGVWFACIAPQVFGWPAALVAPVKAWLDAPTDRSCGGFALSRGALTLWELRADLQTYFPLDDEAGRWALLHWLVSDGLRELQLTLDQFDARLRPFLTSPSPRLPGFPVYVELVRASRPDLQAAFDLATQEGRAGLAAWADANFADSYAGQPIMAVRAAPAPAPSPPPMQARVGLVGQRDATTGRAEDLRCAIAALVAAGFDDFVVYDFDSRAVTRPDGARIDGRVHVATSIAYRNADTALDDWLALRQAGFTADRHIGFWAWELPRLPQNWLHALSFYDEIWAATRFAAEAFRRAVKEAGTGRRVVRMPMAVSLPDPPPPARRDRYDAPPGATLFLFAFDFRSHIARKNPEAVIDAFQRAFPTQNDVHLLIKTEGGTDAPAAWRALNALVDDPRIMLRDVSLSRENMLGLVAGCDALVSLHRAEGFGRLPAEAMALGRPVIATGFSGTADFVTDDCAYPVNFRMVPVGRDAYPGGEGQSWAEPDVAQAARLMRLVHEDRIAATAMGAKAAGRIRALYGPAVVGRSMLAALSPERKQARRRTKPRDA